MGDFKLSKYIVVSNSMHRDSSYILYSTLRNSLFRINKKNYDDLIEKNWSRIDSDMLNVLIDNEYLVPIETNEYITHLEKLKEKEKETTFLYEVIMPTSNCNFNCFYCGQVHNRTNLSEIHIEKIIRRINEKVRVNGIKELSIGWFGGEPLIAMNKIERIVNLLLNTLSDTIILRGTLVTNGYLLNEKIVEKLKYLNINKIETTIDGNREIHNNRRYIPGKDTFCRIIENLSLIFNNKDYVDYFKINVRINMDRDNCNSWKNVVDTLNEQNILTKLTNIYLAPIHSWGKDIDKNSLELKEFAKYELDFYSYLIKLGYFQQIIPSVKNRPCMATSYLSEVYDAYGNVCDCNEIPFVPMYKNSNFVLGNIESSTFRNRNYQNWLDNLKEGFPCEVCAVFPICLSNCPKSWKEGKQSCISLKYNISEMVLLSYFQYLKFNGKK